MGINAFIVWYACYAIVLEQVIEWVMTIITTMIEWWIHQCVNVRYVEYIMTLIYGWDAQERIIMAISVKNALRGNLISTKLIYVTIWLHSGQPHNTTINNQLDGENHV